MPTTDDEWELFDWRLTSPTHVASLATTLSFNSEMVSGLDKRGKFNE